MSLQPYEREFEERLGALDRDSRQAAVFAYTEFTFHHVVGSDFALLDRLNQHAAVWNTVMGALQGAAFVALGRMFDDDRQTHNIDGLLRFTESMNGIFSRPALAARKAREGMDPQAAQKYASTAFELRPGGLTAVRAEFDAQRRFYKEKVEAIRHKVFAHAARITSEERDAFFTGVFMRPLEELIVFTLRLERALFLLYHNGRQPILDTPISNIGEVVRHPPTKGTSSWEHLHAGKDAAAFLEWMKTTPYEA